MHIQKRKRNICVGSSQGCGLWRKGGQKDCGRQWSRRTWAKQISGHDSCRLWLPAQHQASQHFNSWALTPNLETNSWWLPGKAESVLFTCRVASGGSAAAQGWLHTRKCVGNTNWNWWVIKQIFKRWHEVDGARKVGGGPGRKEGGRSWVNLIKMHCMEFSRS